MHQMQEQGQTGMTQSVHHHEAKLWTPGRQKDSAQSLSLLVLGSGCTLSLGEMPGKWHRTARPVLPGPASGAGVLPLPDSQSCLPASARKLTTRRPEDFTSLAATKMRPSGHRYHQNTVKGAYPWENPALHSDSACPVYIPGHTDTNTLPD